jgi:hypothetical protein
MNKDQTEVAASAASIDAGAGCFFFLLYYFLDLHIGFIYMVVGRRHVHIYIIFLMLIKFCVQVSSWAIS